MKFSSVRIVCALIVYWKNDVLLLFMFSLVEVKKPLFSKFIFFLCCIVLYEFLLVELRLLFRILALIEEEFLRVWL